MNETIANNRNKINAACQLCFYTLDKYFKAAEAFHEEQHKILASLYIEAEKERMVNRATEALCNTVNGYYAEIESNLSEIRGAASEMECVFDVGEDLQNALSVTKMLGADMPNETCFKLVEQFTGQRHALTILKAAYEAAGIPTEHYFEGLIFDASSALDRLNGMAYRITVDPGENLMEAVSLGSELEKFAVSLGVDLTKKFRDIVDTSSALNRQLHAVMGLEMDD